MFFMILISISWPGWNLYLTCVYVQKGANKSSISFGKIGGKDKIVWQLPFLTRIVLPCIPITLVDMNKDDSFRSRNFCFRKGHSMGLGTANKEKKITEISFTRIETQNKPISFSLKYEFIAACARSSNSGSWHCWNCMSETSTFAGANELTSSIVHSNWVLLCCGVAGRWKRDGLHKYGF